MRSYVMAALLATATIATAKDQRLSPGRAGEIVGLWQDVSVNDDIVKEDYAGFVQVVDLDKDGVDEIVYLSSSYCSGSTSDCPNSIDVLRKHPPRKAPNVSAPIDQWETRARKTGYTPDASEQIPGEVMTLAVQGNRIEVVFVVQENSPICKREQPNPDGSQRCPVPGRYSWTYTWKPGALTRLTGAGSYEPHVPKAHFPEQLRGAWVTAGIACRDAETADLKHLIQFGWDHMTGKGEDLWSNAVTLLARTPWTWRIITASANAPKKDVPAVFILSQMEDRLIIAEQTRVRTFDRCR